MSLLMQALKKAERAKLNQSPEEELAKPSEAFDELLALSPQEPAAPKPELSMAPDEPGAAPSAAPAPPATPASGLSLLDEAGIAPLDFAPAAKSAPEPAAMATEAPRAEPGLDFAADAPVMMAAEAAAFAPPPPPAPSIAPPPPPPEPEAAATAAPRKARNAAPPPVAKKPKAKARPMRMPDPRTVRLIVMGLGVLAVGAVFAYMYWHAVYGPGSSKNLPMVPMPGLNGAAAPVAVPGNSGALTVTPAPFVLPGANGAPAAPPPPPPEALRRMAAQKEAERAAAQTPPAPAPAPAPRVESLPPVVAAEAQGIKVERSSVPQRVNPVLAGAYAAYSKGEYESARQQYQAVLNNEASNRDALLGMAALSVKAGQDDQASAIYTRLLDANPADTDAQAGLAAVRGTDPEQAEQRLRRVIAKNPDAAPAVFALGNLFARQARWAEAQHQYFQAYTIDANNADYAFNLAIALDRLGQGKLAVTYYQRALALTSAGAANFDRTVVATRLRELGSPQ